MLDAWMELPAWARIGSALVLMLLGALVFLFVNVRTGIVLIGVGFVLLLMGGKTDSEKNGYHF